MSAIKITCICVVFVVLCATNLSSARPQETHVYLRNQDRRGTVSRVIRPRTQYMRDYPGSRVGYGRHGYPDYQYGGRREVVIIEPDNDRLLGSREVIVTKK